MCTEPMGEVRGPLPGSFTDPYSGCTIMRFAREWSAWGVEVACMFLASYTNCRTCYGAPDALYTAYGCLKPSVLGLYTNPYSGCMRMWFTSE